jgi:hypothetical protein
LTGRNRRASIDFDLGRSGAIVKSRKPTQSIAPFLLVGALFGMSPTLLDGVPNLGHTDLTLWGFVGGLVGGAFVGAIGGTLLYIYLPRLLQTFGRRP